MKRVLLLAPLAAALALAGLLAPPTYSDPAEQSTSPLWRFSDGSVVEGSVHETS